MYWIFLFIFIIAVLIPDIIRDNIYFLSEERAEEVAIFLMGAITFLIIIRNEIMIMLHRREKEKDKKRIDQTVKDLVESYSYIGEVNRKMDILMSIALGICDRSLLSKKREKEIYDSIVSAANFLMKAECSCLRFIDIKSGRILKEVRSGENNLPLVDNATLMSMEEKRISTQKYKDLMIISTPQKINDVKCFLMLKGYDAEEENNPKNLEILKVFVSQAFFLFSYVNLEGGSGQLIEN